ncbi:hypothetical protein H2O64_15285 [Kordia sp. YSTF-M3]|uniref:Polymer-forming cytoskeletal protein n=1 Tax=Kordia aestuariivivens TaxID=2759037 RepID=A0ABR7QBU7_9FLAO|nr:hypothetical protein [Kordia aestuariivivens]MBC8756040.1 hypothetical protein [Kordia aestuariivivens]
MLKQLKASSLLHAVFACLLIALVCFGMLLLASYTSLFQHRALEKTQLQLTNDSALEWQLSKDIFNQEEVQSISVFNDDIETRTKTLDWGFYKIINTKTYHNQDTIRKSVLVGEITSDKTALYITDYDKIQSVAGSVKVIGAMSIPKARFNEKNMQGETTAIYINGITTPSEDKLPNLKDRNLKFSNSYDDEFSIDNISNKILYIHSFDKKTALLKIPDNRFLIGKKLKGNIIIEKLGTLVITKNMELEDVIIKADEIKIESGFTGNLQIIAKNTVYIEEGVQLKYPSSILIEKPKDAATITIEKNSVIMGGIVLQNSNRKTTEKSLIKIEEEALIVGVVYCAGTLELHGKIYGSVYTDRLMTHVENAEYKNLLMNVEIDRSKLPETFVGISLFDSKTEKKTAYEVVKEL